MSHSRILNRCLPGALLALALGVLAASPVRAESRLERIRDSGRISLGYHDSAVPFSFLDAQRRPAGYAVDVCLGIVEALKARLNLPDLKVDWQPVSAATRFALMEIGSTDLSCGPDTNNAAHQRRVWFSPTIFVAHTRFLSLARSGFRTLDDLKGSTVVAVGGASTVGWLDESGATGRLGLRLHLVREDAEALQLLESGQAAAYFNDDAILGGLIAMAPRPEQWRISEQALTNEPYAVMEPRYEPEFKQAVDAAVRDMMRDGAMEELYRRWFLQPIPPRGLALNWPMSPVLRRVFDQPTDSPDPDAYQ